MVYSYSVFYSHVTYHLHLYFLCIYISKEVHKRLFIFAFHAREFWLGASLDLLRFQLEVIG